MRLTGAQMVCESLIREGVDTIFGIVGGAILPLYQTLPEYPQLRHILTRHEQGAGHAAEGYSRATGRVGVAWATSGPGATNLVTAIATAQMDSVPLVCVTGQVGRAAIGRDAFQETDITGITLPITKYNFLVMNAAEIPRAMKEAFYIARTGRPGPVLVDIPKDVLTEVAEFAYPDDIDLPGYKPVMDGHPTMIKRAAKLIEEAERPLILAGHGVSISNAHEELQELAEKAQIPVITTLLGVSSFPTSHVLYLGMPGMHGMAYASLAIDEADLILGLGMRFDDRVTGRLSDFAKKAQIIHIDIDPAEIGKNVPPTVPIVGDLKRVLTQLNKQTPAKTHPQWLREIDELKAKHPLARANDSDQLLPQHVIQEICEATGGEAMVVTGVGQHQMWAAQFFKFNHPNMFHTSGGLGTMGFEVPAAMGAQVGRPDVQVWSVAGDGGFQMTMYELATMMENNIPVKFAVINNNCLGMVRQWQQFFYDKSYVATMYTTNPDFVKLADAFGMSAARVTERSQVRPAIEQAMAHDGPFLIDFQVAVEENVFPMIPAGQSTAEMMEDPIVEAALWR